MWAFGDRPSEELRDFILATGLRGDALDIGCGDGRDTLFLASAGFSITAKDVSAVALEKLMKLGKLHNFQDRIRPVKCDARCWMYPSDTFDLVTSATCLDQMPELDGQLLLEKITKCLKDSGILFVEVHTVDAPGFKHTEKKSELAFVVQHYFRHNELLRLVQPHYYIMRYEEKTEEDRDHGELHLHGFANVLARKSSLR
jgi:ubiquinone/menaquinone biosynthesis C-methylase UbiE